MSEKAKEYRRPIKGELTPSDEGLGSSSRSLIETVAWCMAIANARGRFNDVADSPEKEAIIKLEAERNQEKWEAAARMQLNINGHL